MICSVGDLVVALRVTNSQKSAKKPSFASVRCREKGPHADSLGYHVGIRGGNACANSVQARLASLRLRFFEKDHFSIAWFPVPTKTHYNLDVRGCTERPQLGGQ